MLSPTPRRSAAGSALLVAGLLLTACGGSGGGDERPTTRSAPDLRAQSGTASGRSVPTPQEPLEIPDLGPKTLARIPGSARQAIVVTGDGRDEDTGTARRYERSADGGWTPVGEAWPTHNAVKGWTDRHVQGDRRSPIGVFGLTDAGGHERDPGTELPYDTGPAFVARGTNVEGEPLGDAFDYVVAINYNRKPGTTPLDWTRPLGMGRGGGIWFHVDHGAGTQGCVTLPKQRMRELLRWLDEGSKPVVVMGDKMSLAR